MNVKNFVLGIGIVVVFALTLWQGIEAFYPSPMYDDYCGKIREPIPMPVDKDINLYQNATWCAENNGNWRNGYCDFYYECQKQFDEVQDKHAKIAFIISVIVALIAIITGYAILSIEPVGSALIGSGIWALFYGTVINWRNFTNIWRFLLLFAALVLIIWITLRLNRKRK